MKLLKVISAEVGRKDKNQRPYTYLRVETIGTTNLFIDGEMREVFTPKKQTGFTAYPVSYLPDGSPQFGHDLKKGEYASGDIVTRRVVPYMIGEREVCTASIPVFGDTEDVLGFEIEIERAFKRFGYTLLTPKIERILNCAPEYTTEIPEGCLKD